MADSDRGAEPELRSLAEAIAGAGAEMARYRDFVARKAARRLMEQIGLILPDDDTGNAAVEDLLGAAVATGVVLSGWGTTSQQAIDEHAARLTGKLPHVPLQEVFGRLMPRAVAYGVDLHQYELVPGTPEIAAWTQEYQQLRQLNSEL